MTRTLRRRPPCSVQRFRCLLGEETRSGSLVSLVDARGLGRGLWVHRLVHGELAKNLPATKSQELPCSCSATVAPYDCQIHERLVEPSER